MKITVFCGAGEGNNPSYVEAARELGCWIAKKGHTLIYGGGDSGLMGEVSKAAKENGAYVIAVVPQSVSFIAGRSQPYCDEVVKTKNMSERKGKMFELADCFIALPGGIGTLDEISEIITLTKIGVFNKKSVFFNKEGFYEPLKAMFKRMIDSAFMTEKDVEKVSFSDVVEKIESFLDA